MKKMMIVLMMVFGLSAVFAKPVQYEIEDFTLLTNDENEQRDWSGRSNEEIVAIVVSSMPRKIGKYNSVYVMHFFENKLDFLDKKFFNYFIISKDNKYTLVYENIGDGRRLVVMFSIEEDIE